MLHEEILTYAMQRTERKARQLIGRNGFTKDDLQDLQNDLLADLTQRLSKFDGNLASAKTFVSRLIDNRISNLVRHRQAGCRDPERVEGDLDQCVEDVDGRWVPRAETITSDRIHAHRGHFARDRFDACDLANDVATIVASLPEKLRYICRRLQQSLTIAQIAQEMNVSRTHVHKCIHEIQQHFREAGLNLYL